MKLQLRSALNIPFYKRISYLYIPALFVLVSILLEVLLFSVIGLAFPKAYIFSLILVLLIATAVALAQNKVVQAVICSLLVGWQVLTTVSNVIAYRACMEVFSLETLMSIGTAFGNADAVKLDLWFTFPIVCLLIAYSLGLFAIIWFCRLPKGYKPVHCQRNFLCGVLAFVSLFSYNIAYSGGGRYQTGKDSYVANLSNQNFLYDTLTNRAASIYTFGSYSFYLDNLLSLMGWKTDITDVMQIEVNETFTPNEFALDEDEVLGEGYNLIMVLMETFERAAINPITAPHLYEFMQQSCVEVDGYYSIERTCFTDYISQTGMHVMGKEFWNTYGKVETPNSLAKIFERSGYQTGAFHNTDGKCYNRNKIFEETLGFEKFHYNPNDTKFHVFNHDELLFKENLDKIAPTDQNFYSYLISVSTHCLNPESYDFSSYYADEFEYFDEHGYWEQLAEYYPTVMSDDWFAKQIARNYFVGMYSFDLGFGELIRYLKTTKNDAGEYLIEKTAIVMFGDHYYYAIPDAIHPENENPRELLGNRCPFIVYNPRAQVEHPTEGIMTQAENALLPAPAKCGSTLYRFTATMDIYPTVCSLFGIQTDQQLTYGHSIFDTEQSIGVAYMNGYTWGADYDDETETWQVWKTMDFVNYKGVPLTATQLEEITPLVNRTYASIFLNTQLYQRDGFKSLQKAYYKLG